MKLLIATGLYPPEIGGPATYVTMLEQRLPQQGYELLVIPFSRVRPYPKLVRHIFFWWMLWRQAKDVDIVYALDPVSVGLPAYMAARLRGKKFMLRLGGDYSWEQGRVRFGVTDTLDDYTEHPKTAGVRVRFLAWVQAFVARRAIAVVAPSDYLKDVIKTWGVDPDRIQVVYSSLVPVHPTHDRDHVRTEYSLGQPVISTAGRLVPWKGMKVLIEVVHVLSKQFSNITLVIIGDGPQAATLQALIEKYGLQQNVLLVGRLGKEELANIIAASDVFVLNTAYEGLSHQLLEVMDLAVPIVTTTSGGNTELLTHKINALLVTFNNHRALEEAIVTLLKNKETALRLQQAARLRSKDFSEETVIDRLDRVLQQVYEA